MHFCLENYALQRVKLIASDFPLGNSKLLNNGSLLFAILVLKATNHTQTVVLH